MPSSADPMPRRRSDPFTRAALTAYRRLVRPVLFELGGGDPEVAHERMIHALARTPTSLLGWSRAFTASASRPVTVAGIRFPNRVGIAAGLDKDGLAARAWSTLGVGHVELGTVTPRPQSGNDQPRLFRLPASQAIVNRMGFNNQGVDALAQRLEGWGVHRGRLSLGTVVGVSIGKNRATPLADAGHDYLRCLRRLDGLADYVAINVSSPNTPGLRTLQDAGALRELTAALVAETHALNPAHPTPVFVKVAPDLGPGALDELVDAAHASGVAGLIATNTTLARDGLAPADQARGREAGGLSGAPLTRRAREVVSHLAATTELPIIGVGGIMTPDDARAMLDAGASLVQVYTGFIYAGPALIRGINRLT